MALATNNILRVKTFFKRGTVEALMVSYWKVLSLAEPPTYSQAAEAIHNLSWFGSNVASIVHTSAMQYRTVLDNLSTVPEYGEWNEELIGTLTGEPCADFVALSIKQVGESRLTRNGYKRVPFIGESVQNGNSAVVGTTTREALEAYFGAPYTFIWETETGGVEFEMQPIILGRTETPPDSGIYVEDLAKVNIVTSAQVQKITSQTSRKS